jgi:hypothetical protein
MATFKRKPKGIRLVIEFADKKKLDMFMAMSHGSFGCIPINVRKMDSLDFKKMWSSNDYFIVKAHDQISENLRLYEEAY